jgi:hypothetical protein
MRRLFAVTAVASALLLALSLGMSATAPVVAQEAKAKPAAPKVVKAAEPKAGPGQKICRYKFPNGERRAWTCDKAVPCCAWDEIQYTKCGTTFSGCL